MMSKNKEIFQHARHFQESIALLFLIMLVSTDFIFIVLHFIWGTTPYLSSVLFSLEQDRGFSEIYQYIKMFWIIILMVAMYLRTSENGYISWSILFSYLVCDDSLMIHEKVGLTIANNLGFTPFLGLRPKDFGELAVTGIAAIILLTFVGFSYLRGSQAFKRISRDLVICLLVIAFFGVFVDMAHIAAPLGSPLSFLLGVVEDGGEMLTISMITWYAFLLNVRQEYASHSLWGLARATLTNHSA